MSLNYQVIPVTPFQQNCSLVWCTKTQEAALIDPGGDIDKLQSEIDKQGVNVQKILLTHGHLDHVGATGELHSSLQLPIEGPHQEDDFWIHSLDRQCQMFGFPDVEPFTPNRWLQESDTVTVGNEVLQVFHCPGHTPGHIVFYHQETQQLWVGDVLFKGSIGRTDFPKGDHGTLIHSIKSKLLSLPGETQFVPGHGPTSTLQYEKENNPYLKN